MAELESNIEDGGTEVDWYTEFESIFDNLNIEDEECSIHSRNTVNSNYVDSQEPDTPDTSETGSLYCHSEGTHIRCEGIINIEFEWRCTNCICVLCTDNDYKLPVMTHITQDGKTTRVCYECYDGSRHLSDFIKGYWITDKNKTNFVRDPLLIDSSSLHDWLNDMYYHVRPFQRLYRRYKNLQDVDEATQETPDESPPPRNNS